MLNKPKIIETLETPRRYECDVCVCGGGVAGIAAALAAARQGKRTLLLERGYMLGGLATAGLVTIYLPICDGMGNQVSFGIAEELLRLSIKDGWEASYPKPWLEGGTVEERCKTRFLVRYNAQLFAINAERLLRECGVEIIYGALVAGVELKDGRISDVIIEGKSGREAISVGSVVDATGDADVAKLSGAPCATFADGNILAAWYYSLSDGKYTLHERGACDVSCEDKKAGKTVTLLTDRRFTSLDTFELSEQTVMAHESIYADIMERRKQQPDLVPVTIATVPQVRMTRRIVGEYTMDYGEAHKRFDDSVGLFSNWRKAGPVYELPFRTLYSARVKNLAMAGRCISVTDDLWDLTRVIPVCAVSGEAAGIAAAMADDLTAIDIRDLQSRLEANGVKLHE